MQQNTSHMFEVFVPEEDAFLSLCRGYQGQWVVFQIEAIRSMKKLKTLLAIGL
jgi:hypothetical protein